MRLSASAFAAAVLAPAAALAQPAEPVCQNMIDQVARMIPNLGETPNAAEKLNVSEEQLEAALAALDAARLVKDTDTGGCLTMVNAARTVLARGQSAIPEDARAITDLEGWAYEPLYKGARRANALMDTAVYNPDGQEVGQVEDIIMTPDGTLTAIVLEAGGFLDIGDRHFRVPWKHVEFREGEDDLIAPLDKATAKDTSLFDNEVPLRQQEVRLSALLNETVRLKSGQPYGYVYDAVIRDGQITATVVRPDVAYAGRQDPFAAPYNAYEYGFSPGYDFYLLPYDREQLARLEGFDLQRVGARDGEGQTQ